jgi:hypothetical protein
MKKNQHTYFENNIPGMYHIYIFYYIFKTYKIADKATIIL